MTCPTCNSEVSRVKTFYTKEGKFEQCKYCPEKFLLQDTNSTLPNSAVYGGVWKGGKFHPQSAAYHHEVSRRRISANGENYIDRGRKVFSL